MTTGRNQAAWAFMQYEKMQYQAWIADYLKRGNQLVYFLIHFPTGMMLDNALLVTTTSSKKKYCT
jgi:hypothetical protein